MPNHAHAVRSEFPDKILHRIRSLGVAIFASIVWGTTADAVVGGTFGAFTWEENLIGGISIVDYPENAVGEISIPSVIEGRPVNAIGVEAFKDCSGLTRISIPNSVIKLYYGAFMNCTGLVSISIPSSIIYWESMHFHNCSSLREVTFEAGRTYIPSGILANLPALESVNLPNTVTVIQSQAFRHCPRLAGMTLPPNVVSIEDSAFSDCTGLVRIRLPESLESLGMGVFANCTALETVDLPEGLGTIPGQSFSGCHSLAEITLPESVTSIGTYAFANCKGLRSVHFPSRLSSIDSVAFLGCTSLSSLSFPDTVTSVAGQAFQGCTSLVSAWFLGNAPTLGLDAFADTHADFTVFHQPGAAGFTSPLWNGYPCMPQRENIVLEDPLGGVLPAGGTLSLGDVRLGGESRPQTITIRNAGALELSGISVAKQGTHRSDFRISGPSATALPPGESATFQVVFRPAAEGVRNAVLRISTSDTEPLEIRIQGKGIAAKQPEIAIQQGKGKSKNLRDNRSSRNFGTAVVGRTGKELVFVISNPGTAKLRGLGVSVKGRHARDFRLVKSPAHTLAPGKTTKFTVRFEPRKAGPRSASLRVRSNDPDENPFRVSLAGKGRRNSTSTKREG